MSVQRLNTPAFLLSASTWTLASGMYLLRSPIDGSKCTASPIPPGRIISILDRFSGRGRGFFKEVISFSAAGPAIASMVLRSFILLIFNALYLYHSLLKSISKSQLALMVNLSSVQSETLSKQLSFSLKILAFLMSG